jgi:hypothetical protein
MKKEFQMVKSVLLTALLVSFSAFANLDGYKKNFKLVKDDNGKVTYLQMNMVSQFSLKPYLQQIKQDLKKEIQRMQRKSYTAELDAFIFELEQGSDKSQEAQESILAIRDSLKNLKHVKVDQVFAEAESKGVLKYFSDEFKKALKILDLRVIAATEDPKYFFKRNVTYEVVKRAIDFAKQRMDNVPVLNLVSTIIVQVHDMVLEQRLFYQNMMLHYLDNVAETDLGLTKSEADRIFSSIYESRIAVINIPESRNAAANWDRYGLNKFYASVRLGNNRLRRSSGEFDEVGERVSYSFFKATEDGEKVIKNLLVNKHSFSRKMSTAYYFEQPDKVRRFRSLLNLGQVGLGFLPIPGWLKNQAESFIESYYVEQRRSEGALVAYFDIVNNQFMKREIQKQLINPYILID